MKLFSWAVVIAVELGLFCSRVSADNDPICNDQVTYGAPYCYQEGTFASGFSLTPTNITVQIGKPLVYDPYVSGLQIVNALQQQIVSHSCPGIPSSYLTSPVPYLFGDVFLDPVPPPVFWVPGTYTYEAKVTATALSDACLPIVCDLGPVTVTVETNADVFINVDFGDGIHRKAGFAAVGGATNDYWNCYGPLTGVVVTNGTLTNLLTGDGFISPVDLVVLDTLDFKTNGSPDPMYNGYLSADYDGPTFLLTNLPPGFWDLYLYSSNGVFDVMVGGTDYGVRTTYDVPLSSPLVWQEGLQYAKFPGLVICSNDVVTITLLRGEGDLATISGLQIATVRSNPPPSPSGLVAWWRGDGNANDSQGTNHGLPFAVGYAWGQVGPGFVFNGTNSFVRVPTAPAIAPTGPFTLEAWVNFTEFTGTNGATIAMKGHDAEVAGDWALSINPDGKLQPRVHAGGVWTSNNCSTTIQPGVWYHVAMVYDGATLRGFVNGARDGMRSVSGAVRSSTDPMKVGAYSSTSAPLSGSFFRGQIDEVVFFNRALSDVEVQSTYEASNRNPPTLPPAAGLVSWWKAENTALDVMAVNNGLPTNGAGFISGKVGRAFKFDGVNDYVKVPQSASLNVTNITVEFWMKPDPDNAMNTYQGLVTTDFYAMEIANGWSAGMGVLFCISTDGGASVSPTSYPNTADANGGGYPVSAGEWHHVAGTYDGTKLQLYVDGQLAGNPMSHTGAISTMLSGSFLTIGAEDGRMVAQQIGHRYFKGRIDEPSIYNRALSLAEIRTIYNAGISGKYLDSDYDGVSDLAEQTDRTDPFNSDSVLPQRLGHWPFDDSDTWMGEEGQFPLVMTNLTAVPGWINNAVRLNSGSAARLQYREIEPSGRANVNYCHGTIQFWFKPDWQSGAGPGADATLFTTGPSANFPADGWAIAITPDGNQLTAKAITHDPVARTNTLVCGGLGFGSNTWHQITLAYSPSNAAFYIDGIWKVSTTNLYCPPPDVRAQGFFIGCDATGNSQAKGAFDEFETFNYALGSNQIATQYTVAVVVDVNSNGLPDIWEWNHFGSFAETTDSDFDQDGLSNLQEYELGTDPASADSDYDGRSDAQEFNDDTDPLDPNSCVFARLTVWHFDDTNSWVGSEQQLPLSAVNLSGATNWSGSALLVNSGSAALLKYRDVETNGLANVNCRYGTIRFWFSPDWSNGNAGGSGPGATATFFSVGSDWKLTAGSSGNHLAFRSGASGVLIATSTAWTAHQWHQICLTYAPTGAVLFVDGAPLAAGGTIAAYPDAIARLTNGFNIGSNPTGGEQAKGQFDEVETFNCALDAVTVLNDFTAAHLAPPSRTITDLGENFPIRIALQQLAADQIVSSVSEITYPNSTELQATGDYADSFFARALHRYDSSSVGVNLTALPSPVITPGGGEVSNVTTVTIVFGSENLTNMVGGIFKTELGRAGTTAELNTWTSYVQGLRGSGLMDEEIRSNSINAFRVSTEYIDTFHAAGDVYPANTNLILEYSLDAGNTWIAYTGAVQITQSVTLQARARKLPSQDGRTSYAYVTSPRAQATFVYDQLQLGYWPFDTTAWAGAQGQSPLVNSGLGSSLVTGVETNAVDMTGSDGGKKLAYRYAETGGRANIDLKQGTIRFWFKPNWNSVDQGGSGLTGWGRLINFGEWSSGATTGVWQIVVNSAGNQIGIRVQDNAGHSVEPLYVPIPGGLANNQWRHFAITYGPTATSIFVDGVRTGSGGGLNGIVPPQAVLDQGFFIGSDTSGAQKGSGVFDLLDTFNYPLDAGRIQQDYTTQAMAGGIGSGGSGSPAVITIEYPANGAKIY